VNDSDEKELLENVNIIFHCAASIALMEPLKKAININTAGTKRILDFAVKVKHLLGFIHVSTAFSHCYQTELEECHYSTGLDPHWVIKQMKNLNANASKKLENRL
jgi:alcohol-forming fatty acyl-CoA reductase